jgi:hypothetical protein
MDLVISLDDNDAMINSTNRTLVISLMGTSKNPSLNQFQTKNKLGVCRIRQPNFVINPLIKSVS